MASKKTTDQIISAWPDYKQSAFLEAWKFGWRVGSNKRQAAEAWDRWITQANVDEATEGARQYCKRMRGNPYIRGMAPWVNGESWNDELPPDKTNPQAQEGPTTHCECGEVATHFHPEVGCNRCHADKYSTQFVDGQHIPYRLLHATTLKDAGLAPKEGETTIDWQYRLKEHTYRRLGSVLQRHTDGEKTPDGVAKAKRAA